MIVDVKNINGFNIPNYTQVMFTVNNGQPNIGLLIYERGAIYMCHNMPSRSGSRPSIMPYGFTYSWALQLSNGVLNDGFKVISVEDGNPRNVINNHFELYTKYDKKGYMTFSTKDDKYLFGISKEQFNYCCGSFIIYIKKANTKVIRSLEPGLFKDIILHIMKDSSPNIFMTDKKSYNINIVVDNNLCDLLEDENLILGSSDEKYSILINKETYER